MNPVDGFGEGEVAEAKRRFSEGRFVAIEKILGRTSPDAGLRYDLAYLLWETLRNRRAGNANINKTRDALARIQRVAAALVSELAPMLAHPATNTTAADDAGTWLNQADDQWEPLEFEHIAERAASLSSAATEALKRIGCAKIGSPVDMERYALVHYLIGIELKYTGRNTRFTVDLVAERYKGTFFELLKTFEDAVAACLNEAPPSDASIKGLLDRACPPSNKRLPKKA
jgi:hypothetical protein